MTKKNLMSHMVNPVNHVTIQDLPAEMVELSEEALSQIFGGWGFVVGPTPPDEGFVIGPTAPGGGFVIGPTPPGGGFVIGPTPPGGGFVIGPT